MAYDDEGTDAARQLDQTLRQVYDDVLTEDMPARFEELLSKLRQAGLPERRTDE